MKHLLPMALLAAALTGIAPAPRCQEPPAPDPGFHDPLVELAENTDDTGRAVLTAYESYDLQGLLEAIDIIEARLGTGEELPDDRYVLAQGYVELALMRRFYEKHEEDMPEALEAMDADMIAEAGLAHAEAYAAAHPDNADIMRVQGELVSTQIRGMIGGMTKGPEAERLMDKAKEMDPRNGWVHFNNARMHFHNPSFVGGDKDLALKELRELQKSVDGFRVRLYLALTYDALEMYPQARYWAMKAQAVAPDNPEVAILMEEIGARLEQEEKS